MTCSFLHVKCKDVFDFGLYVYEKNCSFMKRVFSSNQLHQFKPITSILSPNISVIMQVHKTI